MARIIKLKNASGSDKTWVGQTIVSGEYIELTESQVHEWHEDSEVFADVGNGNLCVNDGTADITDSVEAWNWLIGDTLPKSVDLGNKLAVHSSPKPAIPGKTIYAVWSGAGDDLSASPSDGIGNGDLLSFSMAPGTATVSKEVHFNPLNGRVWIHEGYVKFDNGGVGDYMQSNVMSPATPMQTAVDLDYYIEDNWIKYAVGSPHPGTHGLAGTPVLIPRSFSKDGDWDYDTTNGLTPNLTSTGNYKISDIERVVNSYMNKIPVFGSTTFFSMTSDETAELLSPYFIKITCHNVSDTTWTASAFIELFRERTANP